MSKISLKNILKKTFKKKDKPKIKSKKIKKHTKKIKTKKIKSIKTVKPTKTNLSLTSNSCKFVVLVLTHETNFLPSESVLISGNP